MKYAIGLLTLSRFNQNPFQAANSTSYLRPNSRASPTKMFKYITQKWSTQPNKDLGGSKQTSPQAKRHKPSLLFTSLTSLTFITR